MSSTTEIKCEYCNKQFSSKSNLTTHKKTAKYCLANQSDPILQFKCEYCDKHLTTKQRLDEHKLICKSKQPSQLKQFYEEKLDVLQSQNNELKHQVKDLQDKLFELASRPTSTTTNNTNNNKVFANMHLITPDHLHEQARHLTLDHIKRGAIGYGEYFLDHPLKDRVVCTDFSRRKLKYKNEHGEIVTDPELTNLSELLFKSVKERNKELAMQYTKELTNRFANKNDPLEVSYFMELATKFSEQDVMVGKMFDGAKNDMFHDIIRHICSKTTIVA